MTSSNVTFLNILPEIRNLIYVFLLSSPTLVCPQEAEHRHKYYNNKTNAASLHPNILCTCRKIHSEALAIFYGNTFCVDLKYISIYFSSTSTLNFSLVRFIEISETTAWFRHTHKDLARLLERAVNIHSVGLHITLQGCAPDIHEREIVVVYGYVLPILAQHPVLNKLVSQHGRGFNVEEPAVEIRLVAVGVRWLDREHEVDVCNRDIDTSTSLYIERMKSGFYRRKDAVEGQTGWRDHHPALSVTP